MSAVRKTKGALNGGMHHAGSCLLKHSPILCADKETPQEFWRTYQILQLMRFGCYFCRSGSDRRWLLTCRHDTFIITCTIAGERE